MRLKGKKILVTGGAGFVGSHLVKKLINGRGVRKEDIIIPRSKQLDLRVYKNAERAMKGVSFVFHLATEIGGVGYSSIHPARQFYNCSLLDLQVLEAAKNAGVKKVVMVSSSCAYAKSAKNPLREKDLFSGLPAKSHEGYGMAKRMSVFLADIYRREYGLGVVAVLLNNMYGSGDLVDGEDGHVIPSLIRKCLTSRNLLVWGDGRQTRDFLYVEDGAEGIILAMEKLQTSEPVNLGSGEGTSIRDLVKLISKETDFRGKIVYDKTKPKGQAKRSVNIARAKSLMGFKPKWTLEKGIIETVRWYRKVRLPSLQN